MVYHFIFEMASILIGACYYAYLRRKNHDIITEKMRSYVILGAALGALIGSRVLVIFEHPLHFYQHKNLFLFILSNKTIVGAIIGGILAVEISKKILHIKQRTGDLFVFPLMLAIMIGRIGCFLNGLHDATIGIQTTLPWGVNFGDGIKRHPTSLYEIAFLILLWLCFVILLKKRPRPNGLLFRLFIIAYLCYRFLVGFITPVYIIAFGLSAIQLASLITILIYFISYLLGSRFSQGIENGNTRLHLL